MLSGSLSRTLDVNLASLNVPRSEELVTRYEQAFREFGTWALWNMRPVAEPAKADALAITHALRTHAGISGRRPAERIEVLCRASQLISIPGSWYSCCTTRAQQVRGRAKCTQWAARFAGR